MQEALATGAQIDVNEMPYNIFSRAIEKDIFSVLRGKRRDRFCAL
jgi:aryl-alcohol dehydrogenase-like predicted oxidoreductase